MVHFNRVSRCIIVVLMFFSHDVLNGEEMFFRSHRDPSRQLQSINSLTIGPRGNIWLGTPHGLFSYNGQQLTAYSQQDYPQLPSDSITCVNYISERDELWVGTSAGPALYSFSQDAFFSFSALVGEGEPLLGFASTLDRSLFVLTSTAPLLFDGDRFAPIPWEDTGIHEDLIFQAMVVDESGTIWVLAQDGLKVWDAHQGLFRHVYDFRNGETLAASQGSIWIGRSDGLLQKIESGTLIQSILIPDGIHSINWDEEGWLWIAKPNGGILIFENGVLRNDCQSDASHPYKLPASRVESIFSDENGQVWLGTAHDGLWCSYKHLENHLKYIRRHDGESLPAGSLDVLLEDRRGDLWAGSSQGGLVRIHRFSGEMSRFEGTPLGFPVLAGKKLCALMEDSFGRIWVGSDQGPQVYLPQMDTFVPGHVVHPSWPNMEGGAVLAMAETSGGIWISLDDGRLFLLPLDGQPPQRFEFSPQEVPQILLVDRYGSLWAGCSENLRVFNASGNLVKTWNSDEKMPQGLPEGGVLALLSDPKGTLWVGTTSGIVLYRGVDEGFEPLDLPQGTLPMSALAQDDEGNVWASDGSQIYLFDADGTYLHSIGTEDAFQPAGPVKSLLYTSSHGMLLGAIGQIWSYESLVFPQEKTNPNVFINEFRVMGERWNYSSDFPLTSPLRLKPHQNMFTLSFDAVDHSLNGLLRFEYRLLGLEQEWITAHEAQSVTYAKLPPGHYVLEVRGRRNDETHFESVKGPEIVVQPIFWTTPWALILYLLMAMIGAGVFVKLREGKLLKEKVEELEEARRCVLETNHRLEKLTMNDSLTGLLNRRGFDQALHQTILTARRNRLSLTLFMLDVDFFKLYNDNYGHVRGDEALHQLGSVLSQVFGRSTDIVARYGGEEFTALYLGHGADASITMTNQLMTSVQNLGIPHAFSSSSDFLSLSIGVATIIPGREDVEVVELADQALYAAKNAGRNRACFAGILPDLPESMVNGTPPQILPTSHAVVMEEGL